jgi:hypothetical protein
MKEQTKNTKKLRPSDYILWFQRNSLEIIDNHKSMPSLLGRLKKKFSHAIFSEEMVQS